MATLDWIKPQTHFQEVEYVFRCIQKPNGYLTFWAAQIECRQANGTTRGGWHFGPQHSPNATNTTKTAVNFGGYDNLIPETVPGVSADNVFRGSYPTLPGPDPASPYYDWVADRDYRFRCFVSPKQNYTQAELYPDRAVGSFHAPNGEGGNQRAQDLAVRCTVTDLVTGIETVIRDIIIPEAHTTAMMFNGKLWDEDFQPKPIAVEQWDVRWSEIRVDKRLVTQVSCQVSGSGHSNQNFFLDKVGWRDKNVVTRTVTDNQVLNLPGVAIRRAVGEAVGNDPARDTLTFPVDASTVSGDLLLAIISTDQGHTPSQAGWTILPSFTAPSDVRQTIMYRRHDGSSTSYTITVSGGTNNNLAGVFMSFYGADSVAAPRVSDPTYTDPLLANGQTTAWGVAAFEKKTNYGRVILALSGSPTNGTARPVWPGDVLEIGNSFNDTPWWMAAAAAQEVTPGPTGPTLVRTGTIVDGSNWRNIGTYIVVHPQLQRMLPSGVTSNTGWTEHPTGGTIASKIDEATPDHSDYMEGVNGAVCLLPLTGTFVDPNTDEGMVVRYYYTREDANSASLLIELMQSSTVVASKTQSIAAGTSFIEGLLELTTTEAAVITYNATTKVPDPGLSLRFTATATS